MYTVTFFSFKGGVGRSMALMNIALELASNGRKVFLIDFDLEAPGLNTFGICDQQVTSSGIVDYVHDYLNTSISPEISNYVINCKSSITDEGNLWLMPAGIQDENYATRLAEINWRDLYRNSEGYFLFEDLKAQIQQEYAPDYLFIDSRTGHTDIGGICTRQLPNAVVFLFFPNEQNLIGLKKVVDQVENENKNRLLTSQITKHFVTSNVPDLDDENRILADRLVKFKTQLGYKDLHIIHRYNSLTLLNQEIFTVKRPSTRLAGEYRSLTKAIIQENPEDKEGAVTFLTALIRDKGMDSLPQSVITERIERIGEKHGSDSQLLILVSQYKEQLGEYESALTFIDGAIGNGYREPSGYLRQAKLNLVLGNSITALQAIWEFFKLTKVSFNEVSLAINLINRADSSMLGEITNTPAFLSLSPEDLKAIIEFHFLVDNSKKVYAEKAIFNSLNKNVNIWSPDLYQEVEGLLTLLYISQGRFFEAIALLESNMFMRSPMGRADSFNYAMADWGKNKLPNKALFASFLDRVKASDFTLENPNFKQCLAMSYWVMGNVSSAVDIARFAQQQSRDVGTNSFSCWTYLYRTPKEFSSDISEMIKMFNGSKIRPKIFDNYHEDLFQGNLLP
ncbi:MAG: ParA family protein [Gammaproteobacteria bacterium]|nr:MAG: ParA family protein [Gammaproteobacteria bacterium]